MHVVTMQYEQMLPAPELSPCSLVAEAMAQLDWAGCWCGNPARLLPHRTHVQLSQPQPDPAGKDSPVVL